MLRLVDFRHTKHLSLGLNGLLYGEVNPGPERAVRSLTSEGPESMSLVLDQAVSSPARGVETHPGVQHGEGNSRLGVSQPLRCTSSGSPYPTEIVT